VILTSEQAALLYYAWVEFDIVEVLAVADAWMTSASFEITM